MWHVSSRSSVATLRTAIHLLLTYFTYDLPVCLSVCPMAQLPRHAGCLQLSRRRPPEMCGLRTRPRTDVDPPRFLPPSNCHRQGGISSRGPRGRYLVVIGSSSYESIELQVSLRLLYHGRPIWLRAVFEMPFVGVVCYNQLTRRVEDTFRC